MFINKPNSVSLIKTKTKVNAKLKQN